MAVIRQAPRGIGASSATSGRIIRRAPATAAPLPHGLGPSTYTGARNTTTSQAQPPRDPASPAAKQPGATNAPGASQQPVDPYDFQGDPVLAQIHAIGVRSRQDAQDAALAARKQYAIDSGDANYARSVLGDEATALAAEKNPYSQRAVAATDYGRRTTSLEDSLNKNNLFYSGARGTQLAQNADDYGRTTYGIGQQGQQRLTSIQDALLQALSGADQADIQGSQDAANRAMQFALSNGVDPGIGGVDGGVSQVSDVVKKALGNRFTND